MVAGLNTDVKCLGVAFHVQTEDIGSRRSKIQTVIFQGGTALAKIETSYADLDLTHEQLASRLEAQHERLVKGLRAGSLDLAERSPSAPEPTRRVEPTRPAPTPTLAVLRRREPARATTPPPELPRPLAPAAVVCPLRPPDLPAPAAVREAETLRPAESVAVAVALAGPVEAPRPQPAPSLRMNRRRFDAVRQAIDPRRPGLWFATAFAVASWGTVILSLQSARGLSTEWHTVSAGKSPTAVALPAAAPAAVEPPDDPVFYPVTEVPLDPAPIPSRELEPTVAPPEPPPAPRRRTPRPAPKRSEPTVDVARLEPPPPVTTPQTPPPSLPEPPVEATLTQPVAAPGIRPGQLMDIAAVDVLPRPVQRDLPTYTKRAKRKKQEGRVQVELLVAETGRVSELRLREAIPDSDLNDTVIESVWHWRFAPASKSGVPVQVWKPVTVDFSIVSGQTRVRISE